MRYILLAVLTVGTAWSQDLKVVRDGSMVFSSRYLDDGHLEIAIHRDQGTAAAVCDMGPVVFMDFCTLQADGFGVPEMAVAYRYHENGKTANRVGIFALLNTRLSLISTIYLPASGSMKVTTGNLDGDDDASRRLPDLVVSCGAKTYVYLNNGSGTHPLFGWFNGTPNFLMDGSTFGEVQELRIEKDTKIFLPPFDEGYSDVVTIHANGERQWWRNETLKRQRLWFTRVD